MKKKIVMRVEMHCQKCRSKAMEIAAAVEGVITVGVEGAEQDQLVVVGDGVDSTCLVRKLRKKVGWTDIVSVEEVKPPKKEPEKPKPAEKPICGPHCHCHHCFVRYEVLEDPCPNTCSIM